MLLTPKIKAAIGLALLVHQIDQKQIRKGKKDVPYITHPLVVGFLLARAKASEDVIVAGILHDTIEDSIDAKKVTREIIADQFGGVVADLVMSVTEKQKDLAWIERKQEAIAHIKIFSHDSLLIKSADLISNCSEIIEDYKKDGMAIFNRFKAPAKDVIWHYKEAMKSILNRWPEIPFADDLQKLITAFEKLSQGNNDGLQNLHHQEYRERFEIMNDKQIVDAFNREVGNSGWVSARGTYLLALSEEFKRRGYDYSAIGNKNGFSLKQKIKLVGKKIVLD